MRKLEKRAWICLALAAMLFIGISIFGWRLVNNGADWASFYGNTQIYSGGMINRGSIYDRNGELLLECTEDGMRYNENRDIRCATLHVVGDPKGSVATGAINMWKSELIGYDLLNGTYDTSKDGQKIKLTIDAEANAAAYRALGGRDGTVGVFNYKTGEIMTMVSTPTFDPSGVAPGDTSSSVYFNTFLMGTLTPGSTFKLVTAAAAIDSGMNTSDFSFTCDGTNAIGSEKITCVHSHGTVDFKEALAVSCNGAFGSISREIGPEALAETASKVGLTESVDVSGIETAKGSFTFPADNSIKLSWAGIGQAEDLVNPCTMMVYMGAIANGGEAIQPALIKSSNFLQGLTGGKSLGNYLSESTADQLRGMMKEAVRVSYGENNYPGLDLYAKSGTAEVGTSSSNSWFVGFIDNEDHPYAFVVWVKGGGFGSETAAPIARTVLNTLIENN